MTNTEAIMFGKEQLEIFGEDSRMSEFIRLAIKALEERPNGKWRVYEGIISCENCRCEVEEMTPFCPNCGSDNRGDI